MSMRPQNICDYFSHRQIGSSRILVLDAASDSWNPRFDEVIAGQLSDRRHEQARFLVQNVDNDLTSSGPLSVCKGVA